MELLMDLCAQNGLSGDEGQVREYIMKALKNTSCEMKVDKMGNLIVHKKGSERPKTKVTLFAHIDEVGLIINHITKEGFLKFLNVGGIDPRVIFGKRVYIGSDKIPGAIGIKAIHLQSEEQRKKGIPIDDMYIDIGAKDDKQAQEAVDLGDLVYFDGRSSFFGQNLICAKALDDRAGCAIIIELLKKPQKYDISAVFSVQEEIGTKGARVGAREIEGCAIVLESTTAADFDGVPPDKVVTKLGEGPAISVIDSSTFYNPKFVSLALDTAKENNIKHQIKQSAAGGNDSGAINVYGGGIKVLSISLPCRNLHSPSTVISLDDYNEAKRLAQELINRLGRTSLEQLA